MSARPSLYLVTPPVDDAVAFAPLLGEALAACSVAAVLVRLAPGDDRDLVRAVKRLAAPIHEADAALILADPGGPDAAAMAVRGGADGIHVDDPARLRPLREHLRDGRSLGVGGLATRHEAMEAGEAGADYVLFGEPGRDGAVPPLGLTLESAAWWAEIFQIPCVAFAPRLADIPHLAATGAEFVALGDAVWLHPEGLAEASRLLRLPAPEGVA